MRHSSRLSLSQRWYSVATWPSFRTVLLTIILICLAASAGAQKSAPHKSGASDLRVQVTQAVPELLKQYDVPSVAVAYIEAGRVAWTAVYGEQSPGIPANGKTLYNIASLTKPISAEIVLRLASQRKLSLDEPIWQYWTDPDIKDNPWSKLLTARLCLSHQTGFTNWRYQTNDVLKFQWEPGTRTGYSGEGYDYVGRFAEKKTGRSFENLASEYVFDPIGMKDTAYTARDWYAGRLAVARGPKDKPAPKPKTNWCAADLVRTTIGDYAKFVVSVMHSEGISKRIAAERRVMTRNWMTPEQEQRACAQRKSDSGNCKVSAGMGLGWEVVNVNGKTVLDHDGSDWGVKTLAFFVPESGVGVVIFTNGENGEKIIHEIVGILYPDPVYIATL